MGVTDNAVNLPEAGSYLVSYFANGSVPTGDLSVSLYLDGVPIAGEVISAGDSSSGDVSLSKTILLTTTGGGALSIYNTSAETATLTGASITVLKSE